MRAVLAGAALTAFVITPTFADYYIDAERNRKNVAELVALTGSPSSAFSVRVTSSLRQLTTLRMSEKPRSLSSRTTCYGHMPRYLSVGEVCLSRAGGRTIFNGMGSVPPACEGRRKTGGAHSPFLYLFVVARMSLGGYRGAGL